MVFCLSKCHGFGIRKDEVAYDKKHNRVMHKFLCNKEGFRDKKHFIRNNRKKDHRPLTCTNCEARLHARLDKDTGLWVVKTFLDGHNHRLCPYDYVPLILTYCGLSYGDKAEVDALHRQGVRTYHIMGFMLDQKGGHIGIGFNKRDLINHIK